MHQESGLQFRSYVPTLMELLEDADGMVRDAAKTTVIELFRYASPNIHLLATYTEFGADPYIGVPQTRPNPT